MSGMTETRIPRPIQLSRRLQALADMVTPGSRVADVGCDHGFLSIYLVQQGISPGVIAGDVRTGPLSAAKAHVAEYQLENYIETRLSDGLEKYKPGEADVLICAGMGGKLMQRILMEHAEVTLGFKELILQPQSELEQFRRFLREQGFFTLDENILCEDGKYYFMFRVIPGCEGVCESHVFGVSSPCMEGESDVADKDYQRLCDKYGRRLLESRHPVLGEYLERGLTNAMAVQQKLLAHRGESGSNDRLEQSLKDNIREVEDLQAALAMLKGEV